MKKAALGSLVALVLLAAVTVWPTRWSTDEATIHGQRTLIRRDRFSGRTEYLTGSGWHEAGYPATATAPRPACTAEQARQIKDNPFMETALGCTMTAADTTAPRP